MRRARYNSRHMLHVFVFALTAALAVALTAGCGDSTTVGAGADAAPDAAALDVGGVDGSGGPTDAAAPDGGSGTLDGAADGGPPDAGPPPGSPGQPCVDSKDCASAWCIETPDGKRCADVCQTGDACQSGYACTQVQSFPDLVLICAPTMPLLCHPCAADADCGSLFGEAPASCVALDAAAGSYCAYPCKADAACPAGNTCREVGGETRCWPADETCDCTPRWEGLLAACAITGDAGTCAGSRQCAGGAYTECSAAAPAVEECNGQDDDCDGAVDEGTGGAACALENGWGSCPGVEACVGGEATCEGVAPEAEVCDGADQNCDGVADEGFADGDQDGLADCVDPDRDGDSVPNDLDDCPDVANPGQEDLDVDGKGDPCDPDADGDLSPNGEDCAPLDAAVRPKATEVCNGVDDDCDGTADDGFLDTDADGLADCVDADADNDGVPDALDGCPLAYDPLQLDQDGDGAGDACDGDKDGDGDPNATDCAPGDPKVFSGAVELCNGSDDNCNGAVDEGFQDLDGDGVASCVDEDDDGDGVVDGADNCPVTPNEDQADLDGDGKGDACENDTDNDGDPDLTDCAPLDPLVKNGAAESCNGADDNCNGIADEGFADTDKDGEADCLDPDDDGDGVLDGEDSCPLAANPGQEDLDGDGLGDACDGDKDGDGDLNDKDCAPLDGAVFHGATEACNGKDDDCDTALDEEGATGCSTWFFNQDGDAWGIAAATKCLCAAAAPFTADQPGDCNDANAQVFPGANEYCNGKDDDCDGEVDEVGALGCETLYADADFDGWGGVTEACRCGAAAGWTKKQGDCNDGDGFVFPGATESCNGKDDDCDGVTDEAGAVGCDKLYLDADLDGWGLTTDSQCLCAPVGSYTADQPGDCDDTSDAIHPTAAEACNGKDDNCNGQLDEGVTSVFYVDDDQDGYGAGYSSKEACAAPPGYTAKGGDCNDFNGEIHPNAAEACNELDDDCDGKIDEDLPKQTIYKDGDGDGFAASNAATQTKCDVPVGWTIAMDGTGDGTPDWDCDDTNVTAYPGAPEVCDGADNSCNGAADTQCPSACPGDWPVALPLTSHMPARLLDANGDSLEELWVIDSSGKLRQITSQGVVTTVCPALTFSTGYGSKFGWTVNPALGSWKYLLVQGTRIWDLDTCVEVAPSVGDVTSFGSVGDFDGDHVLDYVGHGEINAKLCFKLSSAGFTTSCVTSPSGKPYDSYASTWDTDGDGRNEAVIVRGRTYPDETVFDGAIDVWGWDGAAITLEASLPADVTGLTGAHISGLDVLDWFGDGFAAMTVAFGGRVFDLDAGAQVDTWTGGAVPNPRTFDVDGDGVLEGVKAGPLVDLDLDGIPEVITMTGNTVAVERLTGTAPPLDGWPVSLGTFTWSVNAVVGDVDNDSRLEVFAPSVDGAIYCFRLGKGSAGIGGVYERGEPEWVNRTMTKDPYEPNDTLAAAWPLHFPTKELRATLTQGDTDVYRLPGTGGLFVQLTSPLGLDYDILWTDDTGTQVYGQSTKGPGQLDSMLKCVGCTEPVPPSYLLTITPKDPAKDYSASRPYVLKVSKIP